MSRPFVNPITRQPAYGAWAMRGPQKKLHYWRRFQGALSSLAACGTFGSSFAYSETQAPDPASCCARCWRAREFQP